MEFRGMKSDLFVNFFNSFSFSVVKAPNYTKFSDKVKYKDNKNLFAILLLHFKIAYLYSK